MRWLAGRRLWTWKFTRDLGLICPVEDSFLRIALLLAKMIFTRHTRCSQQCRMGSDTTKVFSQIVFSTVVHSTIRRNSDLQSPAEQVSMDNFPEGLRKRTRCEPQAACPDTQTDGYWSCESILVSRSKGIRRRNLHWFCLGILAKRNS